MGNKVTLLCEGTIGAKEYILYKNEYLHERVTKKQQKPENKTEFSFSYVDQQNSGQYQCSYRTQAKSSDISDPLELVVTGERTHRVPGLSFDCPDLGLLTTMPAHPHSHLRAKEDNEG